MPLVWFVVGCHIAQSIVRLQCNANMSHAGCDAEAGFAASHPACEVVKAIDDEYNIVWHSICPEYVQETLLMDTIESFFKVYKVDVQPSLPLCALFNDALQEKNLVTASSKSKRCFLFSKLLTYCL